MTMPSQKIRIDGETYLLNELTDEARKLVEFHKFAAKRINELKNTQKLLATAKAGYITSIKSEILSQKAGLDFLQD